MGFFKYDSILQIIAFYEGPKAIYYFNKFNDSNTAGKKLINE
jgi:hypothetical protein